MGAGGGKGKDPRTPRAQTARWPNKAAKDNFSAQTTYPSLTGQHRGRRGGSYGGPPPAPDTDETDRPARTRTHAQGTQPMDSRSPALPPDEESKTTTTGHFAVSLAACMLERRIGGTRPVPLSGVSGELPPIVHLRAIARRACLHESDAGLLGCPGRVGASSLPFAPFPCCVLVLWRPMLPRPSVLLPRGVAVLAMGWRKAEHGRHETKYG